MEIPVILRNKWTQMASATVAAFAGGYILGKKKGTVVMNFAPMARGPILPMDAEAKAKLDEEVETERLRKLAETIVQEEEYVEPTKEVTEDEEDEPETFNVFTDDDDDWDYEAEMSTRTAEAPYILHIDEFVADEMGFKQETITYYEGDDIMADAADTIIYGYEGLVGELRFGHGSKDKAVVYVRNEKIHMEWEILLHTGSFEQEVLGMAADKEVEEELQHSGVRKFRRVD